MIDRIVEFFRPYVADWGYLIVGVAGFLENSIGVGLVFPGEAMVILGGFYAASGSLSVVWVAVIAAVCGIAGDNVGYLVGKRYGRRVLDRFGRYVFLSKKRLDRSEGFYRKHGGKTVFLGRFIPVVRSIGCLVAGMSRLSYPRFFFYDFAGAVLWAAANTTVGFLLGRGFEQVERVLGGAGLAAVLLLIILIAVSAWWGRRRLAARASSAETNVTDVGADSPLGGQHDAHR